MIEIYSLVVLVISAIMFVLYKLIKNRENQPLLRSIKRLLILSAVMSIFYSAAIVINSEMLALLFYGLYFASTDFLILGLLSFIENYAEIKRKRGVLEYIFYGLAVADTLVMLVNVSTEFSFSCAQTMTHDGIMYYRICAVGIPYVIHRLYMVVLFAYAITIITHKFINSPSVEKKGYLVILIFFLISVIMDNVSSLFRIPVDLSVAAYSIVVFGIYYFSVVYIPHELVEKLLSSAVKTMDDGVMCYDSKGRCVYVNDIIVKSVGEHNIKEVKSGFLKKFLEDNEDKLSDSSVKMTLYDTKKEKHYIDISYKVLNSKKNEYLGCFFVFHDETEEIMKFKKERYHMTHDQLTGLYNREYFYQKVRELMKTAESDQYVMVCCDIKDFKLVNDVFGVERGDELLINIAGKLRHIDVSKTSALYGRMSGDRFAVCMEKKYFEEEVFTSAIKKLGEVSENKSYHVYIHMGVFQINDTNLEVSVMCDRAFMAISSIKDSYTEIVAYYDEKLRNSLIHEKEITSQFNEAIRSGQFRMFLQPQINSKGELIGAEALVRWFHPERGIIPPLNFIGVFEKSGLIGTLDHHIWELACRQLKKWKEEGYEKYHISVNISPKDFYFMDIYNIFIGLVEKYEIDPAKLKLEITETAIMNDAKNQFALIDRLRNYGFEVEIDDFGSGYSSLSMLKEMNVDVLKVDMGFLEKTGNLEKSRAILATIISLGKQLGMEVVIEGVESDEQVAFLREAGCDVFQGYYFDRPMHVEEFETKYFS